MRDSGKQIFAALCFLAVAACAQTSANEVQVVATTSGLGLQIFQNGQPVPMRASGSEPKRALAVTLKRSPFELRLPVTAWSSEDADDDLMIALSDKPGLADLLRIDAPIADTPYFTRYSAMAAAQEFDGALVGADSKKDPTDGGGYNRLEPRMFEDSHAGYRTLVVSRLEERHSDRDLMQSNGPVTMVIYLNRNLGPPMKRDKYGFLDWIDSREVDLVQITFVN